MLSNPERYIVSKLLVVLTNLMIKFIDKDTSHQCSFLDKSLLDKTSVFLNNNHNHDYYNLIDILHISTLFLNDLNKESINNRNKKYIELNTTCQKISLMCKNDFVQIDEKTTLKGILN